MFVRPFILAAAVIVAGINFGIAAAPAVAQAPESVSVSYADLNLANTVGRDILDRRIAHAAARLCGTALNVELDLAAETRACQAETIALAQPQRNAAVGVSGTVQVSQAGQTLRVNRAAN